MFPEDETPIEFPEPDECGHYHGDLMAPFSAWLLDVTGGEATAEQLLSVIRSIILNLRMGYTTDVIGYMLAQEVVRVEFGLRETDYKVYDRVDGRWLTLPTAEKQAEITEIAENMPDAIPGWMLKEEGTNE